MSAELFTASELAEKLKVSTPTIANWRKAKKIPAIKISATCFRFDYEAVVKALQARQTGGAK